MITTTTITPTKRDPTFSQIIHKCTARFDGILLQILNLYLYERLVCNIFLLLELKKNPVEVMTTSLNSLILKSFFDHAMWHVGY